MLGQICKILEINCWQIRIYVFSLKKQKRNHSSRYYLLMGRKKQMSLNCKDRLGDINAFDKKAVHIIGNRNIFIVFRN